MSLRNIKRQLRSQRATLSRGFCAIRAKRRVFYRASASYHRRFPFRESRFATLTSVNHLEFTHARGFLVGQEDSRFPLRSSALLPSLAPRSSNSRRNSPVAEFCIARSTTFAYGSRIFLFFYICGHLPSVRPSGIAAHRVEQYIRSKTPSRSSSSSLVVVRRRRRRPNVVVLVVISLPRVCAATPRG